MDTSATVHLLSGPKQPRNVRGTRQVFRSQPNASCSLAPGNGPKCHPQTCHSERTSTSSRRTPPHNTNVSKAFSMTSQILTHPKVLSGCARRVSKCAFDSYVPRSIDPQNRHGVVPHQSREELLQQTPSAQACCTQPEVQLLVLVRCAPQQVQVHFSSIAASWRSNSANDFIRRASGFHHRSSVRGRGCGDRRYGDVLGDGRRGGQGHASLLHTRNAEGENYDFPFGDCPDSAVPVQETPHGVAISSLVLPEHRSRRGFTLDGLHT